MNYVIASLFLSTLFSSFLCASPVSWVRSATSYVRTSFNNHCDRAGETLIENNCGACPVSKKLEKKIRALLYKIGFAHYDTIKIKQIARIAMFSGIGDHNAFVIHLGPLPRYLYVNEEWLLTLSEEEQEFLIAHETMHLVYNHSIKKILFAIGSLVGFGIAFVMLRDYIKSTEYNYISNGVWNDLFVAVPIAAGFSQLAYSRFCERQADTAAARALGTSAGGCVLMDNFEQYIQDLDAELPQRPDLVAQRQSDREFYGSHPTCRARKKYLQEMKLEKTKVSWRREPTPIDNAQEA